MAITYRPLGKSYLDNSEWPALMEKFERWIGLPYDDKSKKHIATIGIGVNFGKSGDTILNYSPCSFLDLVAAFEEACLMSGEDKGM